MTPPKARVLIVEDDLDIRETLADVLEDRGYSTLSTSNGLEALQLLRTMPSPPSVILLDLMMPIMDGYEFLEERAKDPTLLQVPVAVLTAGHRVERARLGSRTSIIPKPIKLETLLSVLDELRTDAAPTE